MRNPFPSRRAMEARTIGLPCLSIPPLGLVYVPATISGTRAFSYNPNFTYQESQMNTGQAGGRGAPLLRLGPSLCLLCLLHRASDLLRPKAPRQALCSPGIP